MDTTHIASTAHRCIYYLSAVLADEKRALCHAQYAVVETSMLAYSVECHTKYVLLLTSMSARRGISSLCGAGRAREGLSLCLAHKAISGKALFSITSSAAIMLLQMEVRK